MRLLDPKAASSILGRGLRFRSRRVVACGPAALVSSVELRSRRLSVLPRACARSSFDSASSGQAQQAFDALAAHHRQLESWEENCPENFENRAALVGAEIARLEGRDLDAMHLYERAIHSAHTSGFVHNEALANELAALFYMLRGFDKTANTYLRDARAC